MPRGILFVIGASGAGKTAAVGELAFRRPPGVECFHFDTIGVPSPAAMAREHGGGEGWQARATRQWVERLASMRSEGVAVLDGQTRPSYIVAALADHPGACTRTIMLDCSPETRRERLAGRGQPELANHQMDCWAAYLRGQADALRLPVVDTTTLSVREVADLMEREIADLMSSTGTTPAATSG